MAAVAPPLDDLRAEVDRIDQAILELLIERTEVVREIGRIKADHLNGRLAARPAREAVILRRLVALAGDRFPRAVLVRMWRELLAATTRLQTPLSVSVFATQQGVATWDLARDHFGSATPMARVESATQALRSVSDGSAAVAVLPLPNDEDPWWLALVSDHHDRLRVFARLPFVARGAGESEEAQALALARLEPESSGDDLALVAIEAESGVSRGRLRDLLLAAGLTPAWLAAWRCAEPPQTVHLVEIDRFIEAGDERVAEVLSAARGEVLRIVPVGGYPRPLPPA
jgi:chorismate mutase / prephenate dehydratase